MHTQRSTDIKGYTNMVINDYLCSSKQIRSCSRKSSYVYRCHLVVHKLSNALRMVNPIKTWFFELIEDAIGSKAMKQFNKEEEKKKNPESNNESKKD